MYFHSNICLISRAKTDYSKGSWKLWDVNPKDAYLDTPECLMANLSLAYSTDPFVVGDLDEEEAPMPSTSSTVPGSSSFVVGGKSSSRMASSPHSASYHQSGNLGVVPLEDVEGDDYPLD